MCLANSILQSSNTYVLFVFSTFSVFFLKIGFDSPENSQQKFVVCQNQIFINFNILVLLEVIYKFY